MVFLNMPELHHLLLDAGGNSSGLKNTGTWLTRGRCTSGPSLSTYTCTSYHHTRNKRWTDKTVHLHT